MLCSWGLCTWMWLYSCFSCVHGCDYYCVIFLKARELLHGCCCILVCYIPLSPRVAYMDVTVFLVFLCTWMRLCSCLLYPSQPEGSVVTGQLLKPHPMTPPPDMSPFFLRQYVKTHANDVFEDYPRLLTEMVLRLPYQVIWSSTSNRGGGGRASTYWPRIL